MKITLLGTNSAIPVIDRKQSGQILQHEGHCFMIDCGESMQGQLLKIKVSPLKIDRMFISHAHGDHVFGIMPLINNMSLNGRKKPLYLHIPHNLKEYLLHGLCFFGIQQSEDDGFVKLLCHDTKESSQIYEDEKVSVQTIPLKHNIDCCGFLFSLKNNDEFAKIYAYCSDTAFDKSIAEIISGVQYLYHDSTYLKSQEAKAEKYQHSTSTQAAEIAKLAKVHTLILGHYSARYKDLTTFLDEAKSVFPNTILGIDLMEL